MGRISGACERLHPDLIPGELSKSRRYDVTSHCWTRVGGAQASCETAMPPDQNGSLVVG